MSERLQAFRFALDLNHAQVAAALSHVGGRRFAYNHMLALVKANMHQRAAERSYGLLDGDLTPAVGWSAFTLQSTWNTRKASVAPWWADNSKEAYADACRRLAAALADGRDLETARSRDEPASRGSPHAKAGSQ